jgi:hypothetical protein
MGRITNKSGKMYITSSLTGSGRRAGSGVEMDDYSEESGGRDYNDYRPVRMPHDGVDPETLNGPVIIIREAEK